MENEEHIKSLIRAVYQTTSVGGGAHIVLDDYNISNESIDWCLGWCSGFEWAKKHPDDDRGEIATQIECLTALRTIPYHKRKKLIKEAHA